MSNSENLGSGAAQIVFIDANVPDLQDLLDGLAPGVQAFVLDPDSSGLQQIAAILTANDFTDLSVISIVGHGSPGAIDILPVCIKASALGDNMPRRDLWISPHHAMFFKEAGRAGVLIEAKDLVNGVSVVQAERVAKVEYFHIELDSHDVIIAEGALSESFIDDDNRGLFHNAREFEALYPSEAAPTTACYCAPRLEEGFEVEMVRRRIAERAGLLRAADAPRLGELNGCVEEVGASRITGWAQTDGQSEAPVCLDVYAGGVLMGQTLANKYRADLAQVGVGSGRHGFVFTPPQGMDHGVVEVRRSLDGALLQSFQPNTTRAANVPAGLRRDALNVTVHRRVARL